MKWSARYLLSLAGASLALGCAPGQPAETHGAITGRVYSAATQAPVGSVTVRLTGNRTVTSNEQGWFFFSDVTPSERAVLAVDAANYAEAFEPVTVRVGAATHIEIGLLPVGASSTFDAASGGAVDDNSGATASFPAGAFVGANGAAVSGQVTAQVTALDTDNADLMRAFPGDFSGTRIGGGATMLETVVPMAIDVRQGTQVLGLASGRSATVTFPVPAQLAGSAPATIALWSLDPATGAWREEGTATREANPSAASGAVYRATIGHLSWWNCDRPITETTCVRGCLKASDGRAVPNSLVRATGVDYRGESSATSGADGCFAIDVKLGSRVSIVASAVALVSQPIDVTASSVPMNVAGGVDRCQSVGNITLDPPLLQVILEWGETPRDLDSHMTGPNTGATGRFHVSYSDRGSLSQNPYCELDTDDTTSFGPEITTITRAAAGRFRFSVHNYSGQSSGPIEQSTAHVFLLVPGEGLVQRFDVPTSNPSNGDVWRVFDVVSDAHGHFDLQPINSFAAEDAGYDP